MIHAEAESHALPGCLTTHFPAVFVEIATLPPAPGMNWTGMVAVAPSQTIRFRVHPTTWPQSGSEPQIPSSVVPANWGACTQKIRIGCRVSERLAAMVEREKRATRHAIVIVWGISPEPNRLYPRSIFAQHLLVSNFFTLAPFWRHSIARIAFVSL